VFEDNGDGFESTAEQRHLWMSARATRGKRDAAARTKRLSKVQRRATNVPAISAEYQHDPRPPPHPRPAVPQYQNAIESCCVLSWMGGLPMVRMATGRCNEPASVQRHERAHNDGKPAQQACPGVPLHHGQVEHRHHEPLSHAGGCFCVCDVTMLTRLLNNSRSASYWGAAGTTGSQDMRTAPQTRATGACNNELIERSGHQCTIDSSAI